MIRAGQTPSDDTVISATRAWVDRAVIGLNLCPFARGVQVKGQVHYAVSGASTPEALLIDLVGELKALVLADPENRDDTLLIHPQVLTDFRDFVDFLEIANAALAELELEGVIQLASFHPHYQFAGTASDDIANYTNRSPYPTLHLLRESSIDRAVAAFPDAAAIFEQNIATLRNLGHDGWRRLGVGAPAAAPVNRTARPGPRTPRSGGRRR
ncbi:MAG: DUF1415 domain-containing protein [Betaproteobacteria bacterium]|nr:DUF1415 domain-containing protein [Betaproteobacteria bacterium]